MRLLALCSKCDVDPNQIHMSMAPAERYGIAHEMAHIKHEDYAVRWLAQVRRCYS